MGRDLAGKRQGQPREQRAVGSHPGDDRLEPGRVRRDRPAVQPEPGLGDGVAGLGQHDPQRLTPSELDEDRLARLEVGQGIGDKVGVRPVAAASRRVHGDLDGPSSGQGDRG